MMVIKDYSFSEIHSKVLSELDKDIVGQYHQKMFTFYSTFSMFNKKRTHTLINGESSLGKSYMAYCITKHIPKENFFYFTRISDKVLNYYQANDKEFSWDNKLLYLEDSGYGLMNSEVFKVFLSEGSKVITLDDQKNVRELEVKGIPVVFSTSAVEDIEPQILNRFSVVTLDGSDEQTKRIYDRLAKKYTLEYNQPNGYIRDLYRQVNDVSFKAVKVPYAVKIIRHFPVSVKGRRDLEKLFNLIQNITIAHSKEREIKNGVLYATDEDYRIARDLSPIFSVAYIKGLNGYLEPVYKTVVDSINSGQEGYITSIELSKKIGKTVKQARRYLKQLTKVGLMYQDLSHEGNKAYIYLLADHVQEINLPEEL